MRRVTGLKRAPSGPSLAHLGWCSVNNHFEKGVVAWLPRKGPEMATLTREEDDMTRVRKLIGLVLARVLVIGAGAALPLLPVFGEGGPDTRDQLP